MEKLSNSKSVRPMYMCQRGNTTISVQPAWLHRGAVAIRLQHKEDEQIKRLQCKIKISCISELDYSAPAGTIIAEAVDTLPPETCAKLGYREDGKGYIRMLSVTMLQDAQVQVAIICTLCARDDEGHICSIGQYSHTEKIILTVDDVKEMVKIVQLAYDAELSSAKKRKPQSQYHDGKRMDVAHGG